MRNDVNGASAPARLDYQRIAHLASHHPAVRLLKADHLPLIASFFYAVFIQRNQRSVPLPELEARLSDVLYSLRQELGAGAFPREAKEYLENWCHPECAYLRKYYTANSDIPECDLTPATERALEWIRDLLDEKQFVGTESRLLILFQMLREFARLTEENPEARVQELERERRRIDEEIARVRAGQWKPLDSTQVRERFFQIEDTARRLLADFRQAEENFRALDRQARERIATTNETKGRLLDEIFDAQDTIWNSDQGRSFRAFWEFLMSPARQDEIDQLLGVLHERDDVQALHPDSFLATIRFSLLEAGAKVHHSNGQLVEQLRRFLDDRALLENRRIMELIQSIEKNAIGLKDNQPAERAFMAIDDIGADLNLPMTRGLFVPPSRPVIEAGKLEMGLGAEDLNALYRQFLVDETRLLKNIQMALRTRSQISLGDLIREFPVTHGLAEIVAYFNIATKSRRATITDEKREFLEWQDTAHVRARRVAVPLVIFSRSAS